MTGDTDEREAALMGDSVRTDWTSPSDKRAVQDWLDAFDITPEQNDSLYNGIIATINAEKAQAAEARATADAASVREWLSTEAYTALTKGSVGYDDASARRIVSLLLLHWLDAHPLTPAVTDSEPREAEDTETCPTCMSPVPLPQRGDHDYGLRLSDPRDTLIAELLKYVTHHRGCSNWDRVGECSCGLDALLEPILAAIPQATDG